MKTKISFLLSVLITVSLASCTSMKKNDQAKPTEETAALDFNQIDGANTEGTDTATADIFEDSPQEVKPEEAVTENVADSSNMQNQMPVVEATATADTAVGGTIGEYQVQENETLMLIAFKIYGDYEKWKSISNMNKKMLNGKQKVTKGMVLKYKSPMEKFVWNPEGNPYLINHGDTLGSISHTTYGTKKHWKDIWNNNKPMIKNPNKIFAGFTLYTPELKARDVAFSK